MRAATGNLQKVVCIAFFAILPFECSLAAGGDTAPRVVSVWGGVSSHQLIMKSDGTVWQWGPPTRPVQVVGPGGVGFLAPVTAIMDNEH